jgi:hypothetical protein
MLKGKLAGVRVFFLECWRKISLLLHINERI